MKLRKGLNLLLIIAVMQAWLRMVFGIGEGRLVSNGFASLKYFTVLSNLLEATASLVFLKTGNERIKYVSCVSVMLTMIVVLVFLGPMFGYLAMFSGISFWLHLFVPLLSLIEILFISQERFSFKDNLLAVLPMAVYGVFYIGNNLLNGKGTWPYTNDWYGFLTWGYPMGFVICGIILCTTFLIGFLIRKVKNIL